MKRLCFFLVLLSACSIKTNSDKESYTLSEDFLLIIAEERLHSYLYMVIPVMDKNDFIEAVITNTQVFYDFYKPDYEKIMPFKVFVNLLLNKEIILLRENVKPEFYLPSKITKIEKEYSAYGLQHIVDNYLNQIDPKNYRLEKKLSDHDVFILIKIFFLNNYQIAFNDYQGYFYFRL